jgi:class 3 adenylate cyclase
MRPIRQRFFVEVGPIVRLPLFFPDRVTQYRSRSWRGQIALERKTVRRFQPPASPDFLSRPIRQQAALIFIDLYLSGSTSLSETLGPYETHQVLKGFHDLVDDEAAARTMLRSGSGIATSR